MKVSPSPDLPWITAAQMAEVDRLMVDRLGIDLVRMMENAGRALAHLATRRFLDGDPTGRTIAVLAGSGGNGGGVMTAARRLAGWGAVPQVWTTRDAAAIGGVPGEQAAILGRLGVPLHGPPAEPAHAAPPDLILDGLIGYGLSGAPHGRVAELIRWGNESSAPVLSLDLPSGVDATSGLVLEPAVRATATLTLALPKRGLAAVDAREMIGELYLADIGVPASLHAELGQSCADLSAFGMTGIRRIR